MRFEKAFCLVLVILLVVSGFAIAVVPTCGGDGKISDRNKNKIKKIEMDDQSRLTDLADSPWPCYGHDPRHSRRSPYNTDHIDGTLKWSFWTNQAIYSSPTIGSDGTIYVGSITSKFHAINPDGTEKWQFNTGGDIASSPAIGSDGTIYVGSGDSNLYAIRPNGTEKWKFSTGGFIDSSLLIGSDGTIYFGSSDNRLYAVNPNGTEKWSFSTTDDVNSSPAIGSDGTIYVGSQDNNLYAVNPNGTEKWHFSTEDWVDSSPAIASDGTIYVGSHDNNLYSLYPNGTKKWHFSTSSSVASSPAIGSDGTIYVGSGDSNLYAVRPNGTEKWNFSTGDFIDSSPSIGSDGTIYIGSEDYNLYAINSNGTEKWSFSTEGIISSSPVINSDGTIYICSSAHVYKIGEDAQPPTISINSPSNRANISDDSIKVEWTGSDTGLGISHYQVNINNQGWINVGTNTSYTYTNLSDASYQVDVRAVDKGGNSAIDTVLFTVDTISPMLSIYSPSPGANLSSKVTTVKWNGGDNTSGINHYEVQIDGKIWTHVFTQTSISFSSLSEGSHTVNVKAFDNTDNTARDNVSFKVDTISPTLSISSPINGANISHSMVTANWSGEDTGLGIDHYEIQIDDKSWINVNLSTNYSFSSLSDGFHSLRVKAVDNASNKITTSISFKVDTTSPNVTIISPSEGTSIRSTHIIMEWNGSDNGSGIDYYEVKIDSDKWKVVEASTNYTFSSLSHSPHICYVKAVDNAGNSKTDTLNITVKEEDKKAPVADAGKDKTVDVAENFTLDADDSTDNQGIENYTWSIKGEECRGEQITYNFSSKGNYTITLTVKDEAGNTDTDTVNITVEKEGQDTSGGSSEPGEEFTGWMMYLIPIILLAIIIGGLLYWKSQGSESIEEEEPIEEPIEEETEGTEEEGLKEF